ncbi:MAG: polymerase [Firmicutes bacterium]|nr:polymerase [Bacillota bacterium]
MAKKSYKNKYTYSTGDLTGQISLILLSLIIFFSPFFRGLFFAENQRLALIFSAILFWLVCLYKYQRKDLKFFANPLDYLVLALPIVYLLSTFIAINYALAVDEVLENILYFFVFWSTIRIAISKDRIEKLFIVIFLSAIGVALAGLFTASGIVVIKDGFIPNDGGTIASTFQYKNTLAIFLVSAIYIGSYLWQKVTNNLWKITIAAANLLLITVLFASNSHGGYIIYAIYLVVYWFLNTPENRFGLIVSTLSLSILGFLGSELFLSIIAEQSYGVAWLILLALLAAGAAGQWIALKFKHKVKVINVSFRHLLVTTITAGIVGAIVLAYMGIFQVLMEKIHMHGAIERLTMYKDVLNMIIEKPLIGWGGGAWQETYNLFQSYGYTARQVHSYFLQVAVETGLIGLIIALSSWVIYLIIAFQLYKKSVRDQQDRRLIATLICTVLAIISHAVFDFDLSLSALTIVMFILMGCLVAIHINGEADNKEPLKRLNLKPNHKIAISTIIILVVITVSSALMYAENMLTSAMGEARKGNLQEAMEMTQEAITFNPLNSVNYRWASQLHYALGDKETAINYSEKAIELASYNQDYYADLSVQYLSNNQFKKAVEVANKAVELAPLKHKYYEQLSIILTNVALNKIKSQNNEEASKYIEQSLAIPQQIKVTVDSVPPNLQKEWEYWQPLKVTDRTKLNLGIANYLNGNTNKATSYIESIAQNQQLQKDVLLWQAVIAQYQGDEQRVTEALKKAEQAKLNIRNDFKGLSNLKPIDK